MDRLESIEKRSNVRRGDSSFHEKNQIDLRKTTANFQVLKPYLWEARKNQLLGFVGVKESLSLKEICAGKEAKLT